MTSMFDKDRAIDLADDVKAMTKHVLRGMRPTPGGDAYEYTGSMNDVEMLKDAIDAYEDYRITDPTFCAGSGHAR